MAAPYKLFTLKYIRVDLMDYFDVGSIVRYDHERYQDYDIVVCGYLCLKHVETAIVADSKKINLLNYISKDAPIPISFRAWETYEYPLLPATSKHVWVVKCSTQLEKPYYVIVGFQTDRKNRTNKNASCFDHCNIRDIKLFLNSQSYPYGNLNLDISHNQYALLYDMYTNFRSSYYGKEAEPLLSKTDFLTYAPLIVID
ncbi:uncharacterized protein LOC107046595 [Diachasma alloeum]|uniref:uncharacterized protein LOC107046595 n=1 Tax=Diachasma alloeum TaxID=454923 RepID=UPI000738122B|nr:uncharacterized protein LOC107046595 [Diachasma alloeum]